MADHHQRLVVRQFAEAPLQLGQGDGEAAGDVAVRALHLLQAAYIEDGDLALMGCHPGGWQLRQAGIAALHRRPAGRADRVVRLA